jgi:benzoyl-CoA reductase/2-hydroxyglutaryl-CoA dehydratase subunit BcrC/BadD/HgdB
MKRIIYSCPYVPAEWIAAHGLQPSRIIPDPAKSASPIGAVEGLCPYVRAFLNEAINDKRACGVVVTTVCDQMRRGFDVLTRQCNIASFLMNVPRTWQTFAAQKLYLDELGRLSRFLVGLGGNSPTPDALAEVMLEYDAARASILAGRGSISARQYAEAIAALGRNGPDLRANALAGTGPLNEGVPLAIIGGPLTRGGFDIFDIVEQSGGKIVLDATETGERGMCGPFDRRRLHENPLTELANAYFGGIQDASRRPNSELYRWLGHGLAARAVRGIIFRRYVWCDTWHAELQRLKEWTDLSVLDVDVAGDTDTERRRWQNRIRAFLEMLT